MRKLITLFLLLSLVASASVHAGYTHYWKWLKTPPKEKVETCLAEMKLILEADQKILAGADGTGKYVINTTQVSFNGIGEDGGHEPFEFPGTPGFNFCKTQWKVYDRTVVACLLVAADHFSREELLISSDGDWRAWQAGAQLYSNVLKRTPKNPLVSSAVMFPEDKNAAPGAAGDNDAAPAASSLRRGILNVIAAVVILTIAILILKK